MDHNEFEKNNVPVSDDNNKGYYSKKFACAIKKEVQNLIFSKNVYFNIP